MCSQPEPVIWSCDTIQQIPWFVVVNQNWMSNVEDVHVPMVTDSFIFQGMGHGILGYACRQSHDNHDF